MFLFFAPSFTSCFMPYSTRKHTGIPAPLSSSPPRSPKRWKALASKVLIISAACAQEVLEGHVHLSPSEQPQLPVGQGMVPTGRNYSRLCRNPAGLPAPKHAESFQPTLRICLVASGKDAAVVQSSPASLTWGEELGGDDEY